MKRCKKRRGLEKEIKIKEIEILIIINDLDLY